MNTYTIDEALRSALINYLAERPIKECLQLFIALQKLKPVEVPPKD